MGVLKKLISTPKKKRGRPLGSKNEPKVEVKRKRGRPAGAKNKPKCCEPIPVATKVKNKMTMNKPFKDLLDEIAENTKAKFAAKDSVKQLSEDVEPYSELTNYDDIQFYNCTGHPVNIKGIGIIQPHTYLRIAENSYTKGYVEGAPIFETAYDTNMLPERHPKKIYVVGQLVCIAAPDRDDLYIPYRVNHNTKECQGLIQNPFYKAIQKYAKSQGIDY